MKAILLKPLDGKSIGDEAEFDQPDFDRLMSLGAVKPLENKGSIPSKKVK